MTEYKLVVLGSEGVGKSALVIQLIQQHFIEDYDPTIEDSYRKRVTIDDETCLLDILDTAGGQEQVGLHDQYMRTSHTFVCVYSITSRQSFLELDGFYKKILRAKDQVKQPMVLVGNKRDLENDRQVLTAEGITQAEAYSCPFFEASAKSRINIEEAFYQAVREYRRVRDAGLPKRNQRRNVYRCVCL